MSWIPTLTCLVIPILIFVVLRRALAEQRERKLLRGQHPDEPWLWRRDWASRSANDQSHVFSAFIWFFAVLWNAISLPAVFVWRARGADEPVFGVFLLLFPAIGVLLIGIALYQTLRHRKYGGSVARFEALPIPVGRTLRGEVDTRVRDVPQDGFLVRLTSLRRTVHSSGKSTSVSEKILWQEEQRVGAGAAMPNPNGVRVPFRFSLPHDAEPASEENPQNRVLWRLEVIADVPGIDYRGVFELPVFTRAESAEAVFAPLAESPWTPPPTIAFGVSDRGGEQITVKAIATAFDWIFYIVFVCIWHGGLAFMARMGVPLAVVIFFGLFGAVVLYFALDRFAGRSTVSANRTHLTTRRTFLGSRTIAATDIERIQPRIGTTSGARALYDVEVSLRNGKKVKVAQHLRTRRDAEMVAARITRALGL